MAAPLTVVSHHQQHVPCAEQAHPHHQHVTYATPAASAIPNPVGGWMNSGDAAPHAAPVANGGPAGAMHVSGAPHNHHHHHGHQPHASGHQTQQHRPKEVWYEEEEAYCPSNSAAESGFWESIEEDEEDEIESLSPARRALAKAAHGCPVMCDFLRVLVVKRLTRHEGLGERDAQMQAERVVHGVRNDNRLMIVYALNIFEQVEYY